MPFRRPDRATWYVQFSTPRGVVRRSTRTTDRDAAVEIERVIRELRARGADDLLEAAADGRVALGALLDRRDDLDALRAAATARDLEPLVREWASSLDARLAPDTARRHRRTVESLVVPGVPFPSHALTTEAISRWLSSRGERSRRRAHAAIASFAGFLVELGSMRASPVPRLDASAPAPARCRWIDAAAMTRLAEAQPAPFCALSAMLGGTGLEPATVLELRRRDVDLDRREVRAPSRRRGAPQAVRVARVADWAWRLVARHARALPPGARLFAGIDRRAADASHRAACEAEGISGYRLQDQRHSWAVRAVRAGMPAELVARQLGLAGPARVLAVYGRFAPERAELDRWEQLATAQDAERGAREKVALGHALYHPVYQPRAADAPAVRNTSDASELDDRWTAPRRRLAGSAAPGDTGPRTLRH